jgi:hypothetical protein
MKEDNFVIKYKNKLHYFNAKKINNSHIVTSENKKEFLNIGALFGKKLLIDFKKFNGFIQKNKKMIEITSIITTGNKYMIKDSSIDIIKLVKSPLYSSINKHLIDKSVVDTITDTKTLNKEIKKLDKAFIETGSRQKDKEFYCSMSNIKLQHIGDKLTVKDFMKLSKSDSKKAVKIILNVPYFSLSLNEKQILLPRNILLELISIEDNKYTVVAKAKKQEQFKLVKDPLIKADLYDIVGSTKVTSLISSKPQKLRKLIKGGNWVETVKSVLTRLRAKMKSRNNKVNPTFLNLYTEPQEDMSIIDGLHQKIKELNKAKLRQDKKTRKLEEHVKEIGLLRPLTSREFAQQTYEKKQDFEESLRDLLILLEEPSGLKEVESILQNEPETYLASVINEYFYENINDFFDIIQLLFSEETDYRDTINSYCKLLETRNTLFTIIKTIMLENILEHSNLVPTEIYTHINKIHSFIIDINNNIILFFKTFTLIDLLYSNVGSLILFNEHKQTLSTLRMMIDISCVELLTILQTPPLQQILQDIEETLKYSFKEVLLTHLLETKFTKYFTKSIIDIHTNAELKQITACFNLFNVTLTDVKKNINPILSDQYNKKKKEILDKKALLPPAHNEYYCPISLDIMDDPVIASDDHTYERASILRHIANNIHLKLPQVSPLTRKPLDPTSLRSNHSIKKLIETFKENESKYTPLAPSIVISLGGLDVSLNEHYILYIINPNNANEILTNGFKFYPTMKTECYVFTNTETIFDTSATIFDTSATTLTFILARVLMGNALILSEQNKEEFEKKISECADSTIYDSVFNKITGEDTLVNENYVVYKSDQIYPEYIFTLNKTPPARRFRASVNKAGHTARVSGRSVRRARSAIIGGAEQLTFQSRFKTAYTTSSIKPETEPETKPETPVEYNHTALDDYEYNKHMNKYTKYWFSKDNIEIYNRSLAKLIPSYNSEDLILLYKLEEIILYGLEKLSEPEPP